MFPVNTGLGNIMISFSLKHEIRWITLIVQGVIKNVLPTFLKLIITKYWSSISFQLLMSSFLSLSPKCRLLQKRKSPWVISCVEGQQVLIWEPWTANLVFPNISKEYLPNGWFTKCKELVIWLVAVLVTPAIAGKILLHKAAKRGHL